MWFTSDQHFGHKNIIAYSSRPFADVEEMARELVARHNAVVQDSDEVWHLGDFSLSESQVPAVLPLLRGRHVLVSGNHDKTHPCHKKSEAACRRYLLYGFSRIVSEAHVEPYVINHLPYVGDSSNEPRYPEWRPRDEGKWLLHGHVHEMWRQRDRMINVGVDQWDYAPVHLSTLEKLRRGEE